MRCRIQTSGGVTDLSSVFGCAQLRNVPYCPPKIRVLHLITGLGVGGAETMLVKLLEGMDRERFESTVVSLLPVGALAPQIQGMGVRVESLGMRRGGLDPSALLRLTKVLRGARPSILQTWMYHANVLGTLAAVMVRVPRVVWNVRCADIGVDSAGIGLRAVFTAHVHLSRLADALIVNSTAGLEYHRARGHAPRRWQLIENGFDTRRFRRDAGLRERWRRTLGISDEQIAIGMVARFDEFKDHATFVAAAGRMAAAHPNCVFVLVGRDITEKNHVLCEQLNQAGLGRSVRLLGERGDVAELLPCLDIATLCSLTEGFPNAVGEAMATELPCVASNVGDVTRLIGDAGFVVPVRDPDAVVAAWGSILELGREGRRALGLRARARIEERFALSNIVSAYERLYAELARSTPG